MAETMMKKNRPHTIYKVAGKRVPGTTTITGMMAKPALIGWANKMGLQGIDTRSYVDEKADIGHCAHYMIECMLKGDEPDLSEYAPVAVDQAKYGYNRFIEWLTRQQQFQFIASEMQLVSAEHRFGGTADIYCKLGDLYTLIDIKTSESGIYPDMLHQVSAYVMLLRENEHPVDQAIVARVGRTEDAGPAQEERLEEEQISKYWQIFLHCRAIYELKKEVSWR